MNIMELWTNELFVVNIVTALFYYLFFISDPYDVVKLFPNLLPQQVRQKAQTDAVVKLDDMDLESGLLALIEYLTKVSLHLIMNLFSVNL